MPGGIFRAFASGFYHGIVSGQARLAYEMEHQHIRDEPKTRSKRGDKPESMVAEYEDHCNDPDGAMWCEVFEACAPVYSKTPVARCRGR